MRKLRQRPKCGRSSAINLRKSRRCTRKRQTCAGASSTAAAKSKRRPFGCEHRKWPHFQDANGDRALRGEVDDLRGEISSLRDLLNQQMHAFGEERRRWENERKVSVANIIYCV